MATKYGQAAIDYWERQTAKRKAQLKVVIGIVLIGVSYMGIAHWADTGDKTPLVGLGVLALFIAFAAWRKGSARKNFEDQL